MPLPLNVQVHCISATLAALDAELRAADLPAPIGARLAALVQEARSDARELAEEFVTLPRR